ncbi:MAG: DUF1697 domain-containing protein [Polyangiaceae bacterium]
MTERHAAFLRAINVGGNNMLPMKDLKAAFERAGATNVVTYIQSGNVAFDAPAARAEKIAAAVVKAIVASHGVPLPSPFAATPTSRAWRRRTRFSPRSPRPRRPRSTWPS